MVEENNEVVEETTDSNDQPQEEVKQEVDQSMFESAGDDSVYKVDLNNPQPQESKEVEQPAEKETVEETQQEKELMGPDGLPLNFPFGNN